MDDWNELLREKSIFSLFAEEMLVGIDLNAYMVHFEPDVAIESENQIPTHLTIALNSQLLLYKQEGAQNTCVGAIIAGRSANLHSFLRMLPSRQSVQIKDAGVVLRVPRELIDRLFDKFPEAKIYLLRVTDEDSYRSLTKELQSLGIDKIFMIKFIAALNSYQVPSHSHIIEVGKNVAGPCFLAEGKFLLRYSSSGKNPWLVPLRSWAGWHESLTQTPAQHQISALSPSVYLQIQRNYLATLAEEYPEDFAILEKWIGQGLYQESEEDDDSDETEDSEALFKNAIETNSRNWSFPFVRQNDEMDCGAACLSMISQFFGKQLSVQFWRSKLSTNQEGTSLFDLAKTAEKFGFITHCLEVNSLNEVDTPLLPFIALRKFHYLVVYKIDKKSVTVGDPGIGIRKMSLESFQDGFEKIGFFLKPSLDFLKVPETKFPSRHYLLLLDGLKEDLLLAFVCGLIGVLLSLALPLISQVILDDVLVNKNSELLWILMGISCGVIFASLLVNWAQGYYFNFIMTKFNHRATTAFVHKMLSLPYQFFATRHVGDFTHRIAELAHLRAFLTGTLFEVVMNLFTMFIYGAALLVISPKIACLVIALAPLMFILPLIFSKYMSNLYAELFDRHSQQTSRLTDVVKGIAVIKSTGAEHTTKIRFENELLELLSVQNKFSMASLNVNMSTWGYYQFVNLAIMGASAYFGIQGDLSIGKVVSFTLITSRIFNPLLALTKQWDHFIETKSVMARLNDVFLSPSEKISEEIGPKPSKKTDLLGEIEFRDVWFRYGGESTDWVLKGINFKFEGGKKIAIVGPSGSGKSTIAYLLTRMYEPTRGQILIDGRDYREYDIDWLRAQVGLLHQESFLFSGSIAQNIGFNQIEVDDQKLRQAAERASATALILAKSNGFESFIPHGGHGFSVGEKQRIALARLFYQDPKIVILDEATSALDGISERKVLGSIAVELKDRTVINIAHRFSTVMASNLALVINGGKVAGFGSIEFLAQNNAVFQELFGVTPDNISNPVRKSA